MGRVGRGREGEGERGEGGSFEENLKCQAQFPSDLYCGVPFCVLLAAPCSVWPEAERKGLLATKNATL